MDSIKTFLLALAAIAFVSACGQSQESEAVADSGSAPIEQSASVEVEAAVESVEVVEEAEIISAVYSIVPGESMARFELDEDLRSADTGWGAWTRITVVGDTDQVFGDITLDTANLANTQLADIKIDANTFYTVEFVRKRNIQTKILESESYQFITFEPTKIRDMPETAQIGDTITFNLDGDLTIREISLPQTFAVTATLTSADEIIGSASTLVTRESYELEVPDVPHVNFVEDEVELYIDFVARTP